MASKVKDAVTRKANPTTLPRKPVTFSHIATWPGEPRRAEASTHPDSHRLIKTASEHLPATQQHVHNPSGKLTEQIHYCDSILEELFVIKHAWLFRNPADAELLGLRDYHEIIKHPVDMEMVKKKKDNREYDSEEELTKDMRLIFTNCYRYNPPGHEVFVIAHELRSLSWGMPTCLTSPSRRNGRLRHRPKMLTRTAAGPRSPPRVAARLVTRRTQKRNSRGGCRNCTSDSASLRK
ncbi:hypothetical protein HPB48_026222 [Haemaphysalis longicornis]|uniref:Bromo domain-containing protein n=1 Tax=Haemaphysalis longicornis TaxID=44386 RepID=A0A9J6HBU5_HAELO|nr:hypothetical protein HPB48_026222 [Haemaphysalis longicornis]